MTAASRPVRRHLLSLPRMTREEQIACLAGEIVAGVVWVAVFAIVWGLVR